MDGEIFFNGLFIRAFQLVKFRGNCLLDRALLLALASCKQQGRSQENRGIQPFLMSNLHVSSPVCGSYRIRLVYQK